jgi:hypothetical protein
VRKLRRQVRSECNQYQAREDGKLFTCSLCMGFFFTAPVFGDPRFVIDNSFTLLLPPSNALLPDDDLPSELH